MYEKSVLDTITRSPSDFSVWALDRSFRYRYFNQTHAQLMHTFWNSEIHIGMSVLDSISDPTYRHTVDRVYRRVLNGETMRLENALEDTDGNIRTFQHLLTPLTPVISPQTNYGRTPGIVAFSLEVTETRESQKALKEALNDRNALIQELDHRVKNSLQLILSLLRMDADTVDTGWARHTVVGAMNRVSALAYLYDSTVTGEHLSQVSLNEYVQQIIGHLVQSHSSRNHRVPIHASVDSAVIPMKHAMSVGLLVNELISNCLNWASAHSLEGTILVALRHRGPDQLELSVAHTSEDGPSGRTVGADKTPTGRSGQKADRERCAADPDNDGSEDAGLVSLLVSQLSGEMHTDPADCKRTVVTFPIRAE